MDYFSICRQMTRRDRRITCRHDKSAVRTLEVCAIAINYKSDSRKRRTSVAVVLNAINMMCTQVECSCIRMCVHACVFE